ncbi:MAG: hypothetical protein JJT89_05020 [Nitriliruptoraceae bacterium]|nr:hypothetical protein [Nitriliruptoraceae bacterium]
MGVVSIEPGAVRAAAAALRNVASRVADTGSPPGGAPLEPRLVAAVAAFASATGELDRWAGSRLAWVAGQSDGVAGQTEGVDRFGPR